MIFLLFLLIFIKCHYLDTKIPTTIYTPNTTCPIPYFICPLTVLYCQ